MLEDKLPWHAGSFLPAKVDLKSCRGVAASFTRATIAGTTTGINSEGAVCLHGHAHHGTRASNELRLADVTIKGFKEVGLRVSHTRVLAERKVLLTHGSGTALWTVASDMKMKRLYVVVNENGAVFEKGTTGKLHGLIACNGWINVQDTERALASGELKYVDRVDSYDLFSASILLPFRPGLNAYLVAAPTGFALATRLAARAIRLHFQDPGFSSWSWTHVQIYVCACVSLGLVAGGLMATLQDVLRFAVIMARLHDVNAGKVELGRLLLVVTVCIAGSATFLYFRVIKKIGEYRETAQRDRTKKLLDDKDSTDLQELSICHDEQVCSETVLPRQVF